MSKQLDSHIQAGRIIRQAWASCLAEAGVGCHWSRTVRKIQATLPSAPSIGGACRPRHLLKGDVPAACTSFPQGSQQALQPVARNLCVSDLEAPHDCYLAITHCPCTGKSSTWPRWTPVALPYASKHWEQADLNLLGARGSGKDLFWYTREKQSPVLQAEEAKAELRRVKEEEERMMQEALGLAPRRDSRPKIGGSQLDKSEAEQLFKRRAAEEEPAYGKGERVQGLGFAPAPGHEKGQAAGKEKAGAKEERKGSEEKREEDARKGVKKDGSEEEDEESGSSESETDSESEDEGGAKTRTERERDGGADGNDKEKRERKSQKQKREERRERKEKSKGKLKEGKKIQKRKRREERIAKKKARREARRVFESQGGGEREERGQKEPGRSSRGGEQKERHKGMEKSRDRGRESGKRRQHDSDAE